MKREISNLYQMLPADAVNYGEIYFPNYLCRNFHLRNEFGTQPVQDQAGHGQHDKVWLERFRGTACTVGREPQSKRPPWP